MNRSILDFFLHASLVLGAVLGLLALLLIEAYEGYPIPGPYYLWFAAIWTLLLLARFRLRLEKKHWAILTTVLLLLAIFHFVPWHPRKPFLRVFQQIEVGMTEAQVREIMADYDPGANGKIWFFRVPKDWFYDSDGARVEFHQGRVVRTDFMAD